MDPIIIVLSNSDCHKLMDTSEWMSHVRQLTHHLESPNATVIDLPALGIKWHYKGPTRANMLAKLDLAWNDEVMEITDINMFAYIRLKYGLSTGVHGC